MFIQSVACFYTESPFLFIVVSKLQFDTLLTRQSVTLKPVRLTLLTVTHTEANKHTHPNTHTHTHTHRGQSQATSICLTLKETNTVCTHIYVFWRFFWIVYTLRLKIILKLDTWGAQCAPRFAQLYAHSQPHTFLQNTTHTSALDTSFKTESLCMCSWLNTETPHMHMWRHM